MRLLYLAALSVSAVLSVLLMAGRIHIPDVKVPFLFVLGIALFGIYASVSKRW